MTREEYELYLKAAWAAAHVLQRLPLVDMLNMQSHADAIGPILDPTMYRDAIAGTSFQEDKDMTAAAHKFANVVQEMANHHEHDYVSLELALVGAGMTFSNCGLELAGRGDSNGA